MDINNQPQLTPAVTFTADTAQPKDVGNIMQDMMKNLVTPEQVAAGNTQTAQPQQVRPVVLTEPVKQVVEIKPSAPVGSAPVEPDVNLFTDTPKEEPVQVADEEPDMSDIPDDPKAENWKKAREALKTERKTLKELNKEYTTAKNKLEKYEKGEIVPEIITAKDTRIQQLEQFETIVNGKLSDEYNELVTKPVQEKSGALQKLAADYQIPDNIKQSLLQKIVETDNARERNQLISKYFPDAIGATKVENLVTELHRLGEVALEMDKKPKETLQSLQSQYQAKKQKEAESIASTFENVSKTAWVKALNKTSEEGLFPHMIVNPDNAEQSKQAEKNQHLSGIQFGALVKKLHENGLKSLPEDLATGLARSVQLAIGSVGIAKQLDAANKRIAELEGTSSVMTTYLRPGMNSNGAPRPAPSANDRGPASPQDAGMLAAQIFKK